MTGAQIRCVNGPVVSVRVSRVQVVLARKGSRGRGEDL